MINLQSMKKSNLIRDLVFLISKISVRIIFNQWWYITERKRDNKAKKTAHDLSSYEKLSNIENEEHKTNSYW